MLVKAVELKSLTAAGKAIKQPKSKHQKQNTIALFFTGWKHAGENLADVLKQRAGELPAPIQMCDALARNTPKGVETLMPRPWKAAGCRSGGELSRRMPLCAGDAGRRLSLRRTGAGTETVAGREATLPSGAKRAVDERAA